MKAYLTQPKTVKVLRYTAAYLLFCVFALLGLLITESIRQNVIQVCQLLKVDTHLAYILYSWGSYVVYVPYVLSLALLEGFLNRAAKTSRLLVTIRNIVLIEGGIGLLSLLIGQMYVWLYHPPTL